MAGMDELPLELGPKMQALSDDRQRLFAWFMACGAPSASGAARKAGYSDKSQAAKVTAHHLMHNPRVIEAIQEAGSLVLRAMGPVAIGAARRILDDPKHPAHARMIETVLDRSGYAAKTEHKVSVEHTVDMRELEDFARRLAVEEGIRPERLLGVNAPKVIEGTAEEVSRESSEIPNRGGARRDGGNGNDATPHG